MCCFPLYVFSVASPFVLVDREYVYGVLLCVFGAPLMCLSLDLKYILVEPPFNGFVEDLLEYVSGICLEYV